MKTLKFGIEIETVGRNKEQVARAIHTVVGGHVWAASSDSWRVTDANRAMRLPMKSSSS